MSNVLFSIKPPYVLKILSGEKHFEFRKAPCKQRVNRMVIYATKPMGYIAGEVTVSDILVLPPEELWVIVREKAGITYNEFKQYFSKSSVACAYCLEHPVIYNAPISLSTIGISVPPQSFCYLSDENYKKIIASTT